MSSNTRTRRTVRLSDPAHCPSTDEASLLEGLRRGDEQAFVALMRQHQSSLMRIARIYVSSHATAEDVVQESFLAVLQGIDRFEGRSSLKTWLFRILTNRAKTAGQRERRCRPDDIGRRTDAPSVPAARFLSRAEDGEWVGHWKQALPAWASAADNGVADAEAVAVVHAAIARLPTMQRLVVSLRDVESWSADEVCRVLDLSDSNQRVLLHRARSTVRQHLESLYSTETGRSSCPAAAE